MTTPTGREELRARLEELNRAATPGPWEAQRHNEYSGKVSIETADAYIADCNTGVQRDEANAALIVALRNALPQILEALSASPPEGWRLVPVEPTEAMHEAANREWDGRMSARAAGVWQAMLAAAPLPPAETPDVRSLAIAARRERQASEGETSALIARLRAPSNWLQQPRGFPYKDVVSDYDRAPFEAADALARRSADNERLRAEGVRCEHDKAAYRDSFDRQAVMLAQETRERDFHKVRADAAESALAALREKVRTVLGPFANFYISQDSTGEVVSAAQFRAARALLADIEKETGE